MAVTAASNRKDISGLHEPMHGSRRVWVFLCPQRSGRVANQQYIWGWAIF